MIDVNKNKTFLKGGIILLKYWVVYNESEAFWCFAEEAIELIKKGWKLLGISNNEILADQMLETIAAI